MRATECPREAEVLDALQTAAWPECCSAALRGHVEACRPCAELVAIVLPLIDERRVASASASIPSAGIVWWRAQMRARQEAAAAAMQPITIVQLVALACSTGLLAGAASLLSPSVRRALASAWGVGVDVAAAGRARVPWPDIQALTTPLGVATLLLLTTVLVLTPVAIYLAGGDD